MKKDEIEIRECLAIEELEQCVHLQREVFALPEIEISPVRHLVVTKHAGGFTLGAFAENRLVGFVLSVPAFYGNERFFYSHMMAVKVDFQSYGIGSRLKWAQREAALERDIKFIKWTFQPVQARNAFLNLEKLGAIVRHYEPNFYGTDYSTALDGATKIGLDSDRLFAEWHLESEKVTSLANGENYTEKSEVVRSVEIPTNWNQLVKSDAPNAVAEQSRIKQAFESAFKENLICRGFERSETNPKYLLYKI